MLKQSSSLTVQIFSIEKVKFLLYLWKQFMQTRSEYWWYRCFGVFHFKIVGHSIGTLSERLKTSFAGFHGQRCFTDFDALNSHHIWQVCPLIITLKTIIHTRDSDFTTIYVLKLDLSTDFFKINTQEKLERNPNHPNNTINKV